MVGKIFYYGEDAWCGDCGGLAWGWRRSERKVHLLFKRFDHLDLIAVPSYVNRTVFCDVLLFISYIIRAAKV